MTGQRTAIELDEVVKVLVALGVDDSAAREQLDGISDQTELALEVAALAVESEAGLLLPLDLELDAALFELVDGLRQAGVEATLGQAPGAAAVVFGGAQPAVYEARFGEGATTESLVAAVSGILPSTHQILRAVDYAAGDALPLVILDRGSYAWMRAALGTDDLDAALAVVKGGTGVTLTESRVERLLTPDYAQRFHARVSEVGTGPSFEEAMQRVLRHDIRVAWPEGQKRPPGDDLYELSGALAGEPLARALASAEPGPLADVLYRFATVTSVGAHWDLLAARYNPGMSAQGVLGFGQLSWSWFIFDALGATEEAAAVARLLDHEWVRAQERTLLSARQRAWYDLGAHLRGQRRAPSVGRVRELLALSAREAWQEPALVSAALAVHTEPRGDQLTHQPICYTWPAPLYALAKRAGALELLPSRDPFLSRAVTVNQVDKRHGLLSWCALQLQRFEAMDPQSLPALLDPLPVVVDVLITEVGPVEAVGRTLLCARDDLEHKVVAAHGGKPIKVGEVWLLEATGSRPAVVKRTYDDLGEVGCRIARPTGEWLHKVEGP